MSFRKEIEQYLEQISVLEESFRKVKDLDTLPVSFFSTSLDILNRLKIGLYELESSQLQLMTTHLIESKEKLAIDSASLRTDAEMQITENIKEMKEAVSVFTGDKTGKKTYSNLTKSMTINQRFMFLRDLFKGNEADMSRIFTNLNSLQTLEESLDYLNNNYPVQWETDSGIAFMDILKKCFN